MKQQVHFDLESESIIQEALDVLSKDRTTLYRSASLVHYYTC